MTTIPTPRPSGSPDVRPRAVGTGIRGILGILAALCLGLAANGQEQRLPIGPLPGTDHMVVGGERVPVLLADRLRTSIRDGDRLLEQADPIGALQVFRRVLPEAAMHPDVRLGLGRAHLLLGNPAIAKSYGEAVLLSSPNRQDAMALVVRALQRGRDFVGAHRTGRRFLARVAQPEAVLLAATASAAFRVQKIEQSAQLYRRVIALDPLHAEANLRLGSGLWRPTTFSGLQRQGLAPVAEQLAAGQWGPAVTRLESLLRERAQLSHPVAHRLLGEARYWQREESSLVGVHPAFQRLQEVLHTAPAPDLRVAQMFIPDRQGLNPTRLAVVDRSLALFAKQLPALVAAGGRQDLLGALERTTDAVERRRLRGRRTFDGRVWDDVRGVGGLHAATGIEALDDAAMAGFDTLAHELAHQIHFHVLADPDRERIDALFRAAKDGNHFLDYYAASNSAEYFAQGVEAFVSLAKRAASEPTHGHTRFELHRVDPALHDFIAGIVCHDPLRDRAAARDILRAAATAALATGRPLDAQVALDWLPGSEAAGGTSAAAERALRTAAQQAIWTGQSF